MSTSDDIMYFTLGGDKDPSWMDKRHVPQIIMIHNHNKGQISCQNEAWLQLTVILRAKSEKGGGYVEHTFHMVQWAVYEHALSVGYWPTEPLPVISDTLCNWLFTFTSVKSVYSSPCDVT